MPENYNEPAIRIEALSMYKVLEGLIHNINTPLNIIIGYSQQLKKQYPELTYLESITEAGIQIDDLVQSCSRQFMQRMDAEICRFDVKLWLEDEIRLLKNILEIKHALRFEINLPEQELFVISSPMLLGLFLESIVLQVRLVKDSHGGENLLKIGVNSNENEVELSVLLPENALQNQSLETFLSELQAGLEHSFHVSFKDDQLFTWQLIQEREVKILLTIDGEA